MTTTTEAKGPVVREPPPEVLPSPGEEMVREDEFRCSRCGLIVFRGRMSDVWLGLCPDCTRKMVLEGALC